MPSANNSSSVIRPPSKPSLLDNHLQFDLGHMARSFSRSCSTFSYGISTYGLSTHVTSPIITEPVQQCPMIIYRSAYATVVDVINVRVLYAYVIL